MRDDAASCRQDTRSLHKRYSKQPFDCQMQQAALYALFMQAPPWCCRVPASPGLLTVMFPCQELPGGLITAHLEHLDGLRHLLLLQEHGGLGQHRLIGQG